jgi:fructose-bisphosphate aldolase/2-amino-3,7-dideoxy-D-threo-hept-6-ulosonate synthase
MVGSEYERKMIEQSLPVLDACEMWNIPSILMMYPADRHVANLGEPAAIAHAARAGAELGATIVKTAWAGSKSAMAKVVEGCPAPLIVAGGGKKTVEETFQLVRDSIDVGAIGVAMGRNLWGSAQPAKMIRAIHALVQEGAGVQDALALL